MATISPPLTQVREPARMIPAAPMSRNNRRREALLGLLFVAPVMLIAFVFELFPVVYGFYISLQDQRGVLPEGFLGLANFVRAVGSLAYMVPLAVAVILLVYSWSLYQRSITALGREFRLYLMPGAVIGGSAIAVSVVAFRLGLQSTLVPLIALVIGVGVTFALNARLKLAPQAETRMMLNSWIVGLYTVGAVALIIFTFSELYNALDPVLSLVPRYIAEVNGAVAATIAPLPPQFVAFFATLGMGALVLLINRRRERLDDTEHVSQRAWLGVARALLIVAIVGSVLWVLLQQATLYDAVNAYRNLPADTVRAKTRDLAAELSSEQRLAFSASRIPETAGRMLAWVEVYTMLLGIGLIALAWYLWQGARKRETTPGMLLTLFVAIALMIGGYFFISELPTALARGDKAYYDSLIRTVTYALGTVPFQLGIGLALAYLLFHEVKRGKAIYRLIFFLPYIAPTVATAAVFAMIFSSSPISPANQFMKNIGVGPQEWLQTTKGLFEVIANQIRPGTQLPNFLIGPSLPLLSAILFAIWVFSGYNAVVFMAGLGNVPKEVYEAAQVDGANRWTTFRRIVFPLISPTTYFLTLLAIIGTFRTFTHIWVLRNDARGGIDTAMIYIYETIQFPTPPNRTQPYAAALSFLLFGIILILTIVQNRYSRDRVFYG